MINSYCVFKSTQRSLRKLLNQRLWRFSSSYHENFIIFAFELEFLVAVTIYLSVSVDAWQQALGLVWPVVFGRVY